MNIESQDFLTLYGMSDMLLRLLKDNPSAFDEGFCGYAEEIESRLNDMKQKYGITKEGE